MNCAEARDWLDPYMDGELGIERTLEFERHLALCPNCTAELARRRALGAALRDKLPRYAAPPALHQLAQDGIAPEDGDRAAARPAQRSAMPPWMRMAASFILVAGLSATLTYYAVAPGRDIVSDEVFASHMRGLQSENRLIDVVSSDEHTVKPWLDARLDFAPPVEDLSAAGFTLIGGRIDYIAGHTAAALVYHARKHVITLFIWPSDGRARPIAISARRGDTLVQWSDWTMTYWAISDIPAPDLLEFCRRFQAAKRAPAPAAAKP